MGNARMFDKINHVIAAEPFSLIRSFTQKAAEVKDCVYLTLGEPEFDTAPCIKESCGEALRQNMTHYSLNAGTLALREKIAAWELKKHGCRYEPSEIIVTAGATEALMVAIRGIVNPGDEVIIPAPAFGLYEALVRLSYGVPVRISTEKTGFQLTREALHAAITEKTKAIILTSPNNPTGVVYEQETLAMIRELALERDLFVICDDVYRQLTYEPCPAFSDYHDLKDRLLIVQSFSKPYAMTGWRVGYLMGDKRIMEKLTVLHAYTVVSVPTFVQHACLTALDTEPEEMVETYRRRRDYICGELAAMGLSVTRPKGAFYVFPSIEKFGMSSMDFCLKMLYEGKLAAVPGIAFGCDTHIRLSYCYADEQLREAMKRMRAFIVSLEA